MPNRFADWGKATVAGDDHPTAPDAPQRSHPLRSPRVIAGLVVAGVAIGLVLAATLGGSSAPGPGASTTALSSDSFTTAYPDGFVLSVSHPDPGATVYQLTSPATASVAPLIQEPPPAGVIAIDITDVPVALFASLDHDPDAVSQTPIEILPSSVAEPSGAASVVNSDPIHASRLDGVAAAAAGYSYTFQGVEDVQSDVLARHGQELEGIVMDTEPALSAQGQAALATILAHWSWTASGSSPRSSGGAVTS